VARLIRPVACGLSVIGGSAAQGLRRDWLRGDGPSRNGRRCGWCPDRRSQDLPRECRGRTHLLVVGRHARAAGHGQSRGRRVEESVGGCSPGRSTTSVDPVDPPRAGLHEAGRAGSGVIGQPPVPARDGDMGVPARTRHPGEADALTIAFPGVTLFRGCPRTCLRQHGRADLPRVLGSGPRALLSVPGSVNDVPGSLRGRGAAWPVLA
jgi:hypothetical protein